MPNKTCTNFCQAYWWLCWMLELKVSKLDQPTKGLNWPWNFYVENLTFRVDQHPSDWCSIVLTWMSRDCQWVHMNKRTRGWEEDHQLLWLPSLRLWYPIDDLVLQKLPGLAIEAHRQSHRSWEVAARSRPSMTQRNHFSPSARLHVTFSLVLRTSSPTPAPLTFMLERCARFTTIL